MTDNSRPGARGTTSKGGSPCAERGRPGWATGQTAGGEQDHAPGDEPRRALHKKWGELRPGEAGTVLTCLPRSARPAAPPRFLDASAADPRSGPPGRPEAAAEGRAYAARARRPLPSSPARAGPCPVSPAPHSFGDLRETPASFPSAARSRPPQSGRLPRARLGRGTGTLCPPRQLSAARFTRFPRPDSSPPSRPGGERTAQAQTTKSQLRRRRACAEAGEHPPPPNGAHLPGGGVEGRVLSCPRVVSGGWDVPCRGRWCAGSLRQSLRSDRSRS